MYVVQEWTQSPLHQITKYLFVDQMNIMLHINISIPSHIFSSKKNQRTLKILRVWQVGMTDLFAWQCRWILRLKARHSFKNTHISMSLITLNRLTKDCTCVPCEIQNNFSPETIIQQSIFQTITIIQ